MALSLPAFSSTIYSLVFIHRWYVIVKQDIKLCYWTNSRMYSFPTGYARHHNPGNSSRWIRSKCIFSYNVLCLSVSEFLFIKITQQIGMFLVGCSINCFLFGTPWFWYLYEWYFLWSKCVQHSRENHNWSVEIWSR